MLFRSKVDVRFSPKLNAKAFLNVLGTPFGTFDHSYVVNVLKINYVYYLFILFNMLKMSECTLANQLKIHKFSFKNLFT